MTSQFISLNGQQFHTLSWGNPGAPILLMLHGFPEYSGAWEELATRLADRYHIIAPDQRGFGQSWAPPEVGEYTTSKLVGDMAALIAALDTQYACGPVTVIGHDWGAAVGYGLAMFAPKLVNRLIILNGVHPAPFQREMARGGAQSEASQYILFLRQSGSEDRLAANDFALLLKLFSANMDLSWLAGDRLTAYKVEWSRPGRLKSMINWYRASPLQVAAPGQPLTNLPALARDKLMVHCPHLLIWGLGDTALLPASYEGLSDYVPDLTVKTIPEADHWLCHQCPDAVADLIRTWLA